LRLCFVQKTKIESVAFLKDGSIRVYTRMNPNPSMQSEKIRYLAYWLLKTFGRIYS